MARYKKHGREEPEDEGLLVFGYSSRIYPNDSRSELIAGESHLQPWPLDEGVLIDRFDVRLLLSTIPSEKRGEGMEEKEEKECEEERWRDLHDAELASLKRVDEEESRPRKAEFAFSYDTPATAAPSSSRVEEDDGADSEDEPFVPPPGIKLPRGLETPDNQKLNHVIERTALFVAKQGAQMEIVIKAKQRNNQEQFGFLHFDHILNPYYKYIQKLIREGKYTPDLENKKKKKSNAGDGKENGRKESGNALTALMAQHGSDSESDSDCELHPSLLAGSRRGGSPDPVEKGEKSFAGPQKRPKTPPPLVTRTDYRIETANDAYSALFKNLAQINVDRDRKKEEEERVERGERGEEKREIERVVEREEESEESRREWDDFTQWFISFYGMSPPIPFCNMPYIPPPPDMEKALTGYARYVGENGPEAEFALKGRVELQLHFLTPSNPHHLYYLSAVRRAQWEKSQKDETEAMHASVLPPPPPLNRKQRRMAFMDAPQISTTSTPSVIDPAQLILAAAEHSYETPMVKSCSSPTLSTVYGSPSYASPRPHSPAVSALPPTPISIPPPPPSDPSLSLPPPSVALTLLPCPVPPSINGGGFSITPIMPPARTEILNDRQLKARLFMEKILNDKRKKKEDDKKEEEEEKTKRVEVIEEGEILEEKKEERKEKRERGEKKEEKKKVDTSFFDNLIKSKMDALLKETAPGSFAVEKKKEEMEKEKKEKEERERKEKEKREREKKEERREKERGEKKRKKKEKRRRRSESRSSSSEDERRRRRRRSRSRSSDIPSKYRRR